MRGWLADGTGGRGAEGTRVVRDAVLSRQLAHAWSGLQDGVRIELSFFGRLGTKLE